VALHRREKYSEVEIMHRRALAGRETMLGFDHPQTLQCVGNLGVVQHRQEKYKEAEIIHRSALLSRRENTLTS